MNQRQFLMASAATMLLPGTSRAVSPRRLRAERVTARILPEGNGLTPLLGFNGHSPGPEIRTRQGEQITVALENGLDRALRSTGTVSTSTTPWMGYPT